MTFGTRFAGFLFGMLAAASVAAQDVSLGGSVRIGGSVDVTEPTTGSLNAAGGEVTIEAPIAGSLRAAGGKIAITESAPITGEAMLAGGEVKVNGAIGNDLHVGGGQVTIDAPVGGDAFVGAGSLVLGPNARIEGKLKFRGGELKQDPAAVVVGGVTHTERRHHRVDSADDVSVGYRFTHGWVWSAGLVILAALLAGALPGPSARLAQELTERPWHTPLIGFLALTAIPVAAVLLCITIIGIPIGLLTLVLYAGLLMFGYVWLGVVLGGLLLDRFNAATATETAWRVGAAALAMIVLALLVRVPFLGGFVKFAALVVGVGMIVGAVMRRIQPPAAEKFS